MILEKMGGELVRCISRAAHNAQERLLKIKRRTMWVDEQALNIEVKVGVSV